MKYLVRRKDGSSEEVEAATLKAAFQGAAVAKGYSDLVGVEELPPERQDAPEGPKLPGVDPVTNPPLVDGQGSE